MKEGLFSIESKFELKFEPKLVLLKLDILFRKSFLLKFKNFLILNTFFFGIHIHFCDIPFF